MKLKYYTVYYVIKRNGEAHIVTDTVVAKNKREAFEAIEENAQMHYSRHAFYKTTVPPVEREDGILWGGKTLFSKGKGHRLW